MRYLCITYYQKPTGQIDEATMVTKSLKQRDIAEASVILDFKLLKVVKASMSGTVVPKDWEPIVGYYYKHYRSIIDRLFNENNWEVVSNKVEEKNGDD